MTEDFTRDGYRALLQSLVDKGYQARAYDEADPLSPDLILRHDLDMSLQAAIPIAEIERDLGLRSHYFILLRTEMYTLFSDAGLTALRQIQALGHEIGLHLDASLYDDTPEALEAAANWECGVLEQALQSPVHTISFHRPAPALLGMEQSLGGRTHAYQKRFFSDMGYCSDSRGGWHHGHPLENEAVAEGRALQLLTHPIWWPATRQPVQERLDRFAGERYRLLRRELGDNCVTYDPEIAPMVPAEQEEATGS